MGTETTGDGSAATLPPPPTPSMSIASTLAPYRAVAARAFRRFSTYRGATLAGIVTNTVFGFIYAYAFDAVHTAREGDVNGFSSAQTATYVFAAQAFLMMTGALGDREISDRIRTGDIAADLYRPVDFQAWWLAHDLGKSSYLALGRGIPPFVVGALVLGLAVPTSPIVWLSFILATVLGMTLAFTIRFMANLSGFWFLDARGIVSLVALMQMFLSGHLVPLYFMPERLERLARISPFAGITAHPIEIFIGARTGWELVAIYASQVAWIIVLLIAGRLLLRAARRKLVIQGG